MFLSLLLRTLLPFGLPVVMIVLVIFLARSRFPQLASVPLWVYLAAIGLILVVWGIVLFLKWRREKADAAAIEAGILASSGSQADVAPARRAELEQIQTAMGEAIAQLKSGPQGKKALYTIPWYMIIGPPAIGKTTAILNSGLNFPSMTTAKRLRGQGGTRNCDWWFSSEAILLDTAGRYAQSTDRTETEKEWFGFLDLLKKHRKKNPLNGLILGYSFETLIDSDDEKLIHDARELRTRIDETMAKIGFTFPVYVLFTKGDLIAGFADFFASLPPAERTQVWGTSFPAPLPADQTPTALFLREFDQIVARLRDFRARRLARMSASEDWGKVFMFPEEFAALRPKLHLFLETLFEKNPFSVDQPVFRGAYFSSGKQMGTPLDLVVRRIQGILGGSPLDVAMETQPEKEDAFFVRDLFAKLLRADQSLSQQTRSGSSRWFRLQLVLSGVALVAAILASVFVLTSYFRLDRRMATTKSVVEEFEQSSEDLAPDVETIETLGGLREHVAGSWRSWPLTVASNVRAAGNELYLDALAERVLRPIEEDLAEQLEFPDELDADQVRRTLQAELLLVYPDRRGEIGDEKDLASALFDFGIEGASEAPERLEPFEEMCKDFLEAGEPLHGPEARQVPLRRGARALKFTHTTEAFFGGIVAGASRELPDLDLTVKRMTGDEKVLSSESRIRAAFTRDGWSEYVEKRFKDVKGVIERDNELITLAGESPAEDAPQRSDLLAMYAEAFPEEWASFLESVEMRTYSGCGDAEPDFKELKSRKSSPVIQILNTLSKQAEFGMLSADVKQIEAAVAPVRNFVEAPSEDDPAPIGDYRKSLDDLYDLVAECAESDEFKFEARDLRRISDDIDEYVDDSGGEELADALGKFLKVPITRAQQILTRQQQQTTASETNSKWREKVYQDYASGLAGRYPFGGGAPAAVNAIAKLLGAGGGLDEFAAYADEAKVAIGSGVKGAIRDADAIRNSMSVGGGQISFGFRVELLEPRALGGAEGEENLRVLDRVTLTVNGEELVRRSSNRSMNVQWSSQTTETRSSLTLEHTSAGAVLGEIEKEDSIWSWFRLVDEGESRSDGGGWILTWEFPDVGIAVDARVTMLSGGECPFVPGSTFRRFRLPESAF